MAACGSPAPDAQLASASCAAALFFSTSRILRSFAKIGTGSSTLSIVDSRTTALRSATMTATTFVFLSFSTNHLVYMSIKIEV